MGEAGGPAADDGSFPVVVDPGAGEFGERVPGAFPTRAGTGTSVEGCAGTPRPQPAPDTIAKRPTTAPSTTPRGRGRRTNLRFRAPNRRHESEHL